MLLREFYNIYAVIVTILKPEIQNSTSIVVENIINYQLRWIYFIHCG